MKVKQETDIPLLLLLLKKKAILYYKTYSYILDKLKEFSGEEIEITASYPVEVETSTLKLLRLAERDENNEGVNVYPEFSRIAKDEGFPDIAILFSNVASVENVHSKRFKKYADRLENGSLFKDTATSAWMCTNCGFIYEGQVAPAKCPVCAHPQGFFIKFDESSFEGKELILNMK